MKKTMPTRKPPGPARKRGELEQDRAFRELSSADATERTLEARAARGRWTTQPLDRERDPRYSYLTLPHD